MWLEWDTYRAPKQFYAPTFNELYTVPEKIIAKRSPGANRRSNIHLYPDDWKKLPIPDVSLERQQPLVDRVDRILAAKSANPAADISALEAEIDRLVSGLYNGDGRDTRDKRDIRDVQGPVGPVSVPTVPSPVSPVPHSERRRP